MQRLEAWSDPLRRINAPRPLRKARRRAPPSVPLPELKRVVTRYGIVEMPRDLDPDLLSPETIVGDPIIRVVPDAELTTTERELLERAGVERLPKLTPRPALSQPQLCFLQVVAELERRGEPFGWEEAYLHFQAVRDITSENLKYFNAKRAGDALVQRGLLMDGPRLTRTGRRRVYDQEESDQLKKRLGIREYPLLRIERHPQVRAYDEIYILKDGQERCLFRYECRGFRCPKIVYVPEGP